MEAAAYDAGVDVLVSACPARARGAWTGSRRGGRRGCVFDLAELPAAHYAWLAQHRVPFVMIDPAVEPPPGVVSVGAANWQGGVTATEHLLKLGHGGSP
ncbi:Transcriptional regulator OS=Streptomyces fumanus OX=67302 GN=GCM10018772_40270 PE=4 SV=1 [Streptomyces fumanus]